MRLPSMMMDVFSIGPRPLPSINLTFVRASTPGLLSQFLPAQSLSCAAYSIPAELVYQETIVGLSSRDTILHPVKDESGMGIQWRDGY
jgi:hypothetical protein